MAALPPQVGPYELVRRLGRGGMAETFMARRRGPGGFVQECCIKRVLPQLAEEGSFRDQFMDEATLHGRLQHGNIVHVHDFGEDQGTYFLAMELVRGCDLAQLIEQARKRGKGGLTADLAVLVAVDLCQALSYAHGLRTEQGPLGVVHRDLTPSNVLLSRAGEVKLSDFGIARAAQRRHRTETGFTKGKLCYMSPEQIEAAVDLDARSDLFALGVVMYEMLSGVRPFDASSGNDLSVLPRILQGEHTPLSERVPTLDAQLCRVVERLLSPSRDDRPADANEVLQALSPFAPPVTARRTLAARVEAASQPRGEEPTSQGLSEAADAPTVQASYVAPTRTSVPVAARAGDGRAETVPLPQAAGVERNPAASSPRAPSRGALAMLALAFASVVLVLGVWLGRSRSPAPPGAAASSPAPVPIAPQASQRQASRPAPAAPHAKAPAAAGPSADSEAPEPRPASAQRPERSRTDLKIVVVPYGNIWVDGKKRGATRLRLDLPAGRHRIGIGRGDEPTRTEEVVLRPGSRTLEYQLSGVFQ